MRHGWIRSSGLKKGLLGLMLSALLGLSLLLSGSGPVWAAVSVSGDGVQIAAAEVLDPKIDVNNTILRNYRRLRGFYPTLARKLVQFAPYDSMDDLLGIPELTAQQKELIAENADNFEFGAYQEGRYQLENRINQGYYG